MLNLIWKALHTNLITVTIDYMLCLISHGNHAVQGNEPVLLQQLHFNLNTVAVHLRARALN